MHDIAHKSSGVAPADNDPRRLTRRDLIPIRLRELDVLGKICEVLDCLLDRMDLQALHREVRIRVRLAEETVLDNDGRALRCLCDHTIDRGVSEVPGEPCGNVRSAGCNEVEQCADAYHLR